MLYCAPWPLDFPNHLHVSPCALLRQATALESSLAAAHAPHRADGSLETKQKTDSTNKPMMVHSQIYLYILHNTYQHIAIPCAEGLEISSKQMFGK